MIGWACAKHKPAQGSFANHSNTHKLSVVLATTTNEYGLGNYADPLAKHTSETP